MKLAIGSIPFDFSQNNNVFEYDITEPGKPLYAFVAYESPKRVLRHKNDSELVAVGRLVIQIDPDREKRRRRFVAIPLNTAVEIESELTYVCCFTNPSSGAVLALFEVPIVTEPATTGTVLPERSGEINGTPVVTSLPGPGEAGA